MQFHKVILMALAVCIAAVSCNNDLDVIAPYDQVPVAYGLLNPGNDTQYVRLQKSYLGEGNALVMAQNADSIYYDTSDVEMVLQEIRANNVTKTFNFKSLTGIQKDEGLFTDQGHYIFACPLNGNKLDPAASYRLRIIIRSRGDSVTANTRIVEPITQRTLLSQATKINLADNDPYIVRFVTGRYARIFGLVMRIYYRETTKLTQLTTQKFIDWKLDNVLSRTLNGGEELSFELEGQKIFQFIGSKVKEDPSVVRGLFDFKAEFIFTVGTDDLFNYIQVNSPNNTVNYIPEFTNFSGGAKGIFTCRLDTSIGPLQFNELTYDSLANGVYTRHIFK